MIKYIEKVQLKNFQSHVNTIIHLDPQLNIIVGESDSGKTAILRAIKWVLYNEPLGDFFIRQGETECSVRLVFNDKVEVERFRSPSKNQYRLSLPNGDEQIYEGFGSSVPKEVIDATGIQKIELDQNESRTINLGEQLEGAFLLSEKDSIKASSIGRLVGVNIIDDALRQSLTDTRNLNIEKNRILENNKKLKNEYEKYEYLKDLEKDLDKLNILKEQIDEKLKLKESLSGEFIKLNNIIQQSKKIELILLDLKNIDLLENQVWNLSIKLKNLLNLQNIKKRYFNNKSSINKTNKRLEGLKYLDLLEDDIKVIDQQYKKLSNYKSLYNKNTFVKENKKHLNEKLMLFKDVDALFLNNKDIEDKTALLNKYINIYNRLLDTKKRLAFGETFYNRFKYVDNLYNIDSKLNEKLTKLNKLKEINKEIKRINIKKDNEKKEINKIKGYSKVILDKYKIGLEEQEVCPLCSSVLDQEHIEKIVNEYMEDINI